ncbi:MAG: hypothetical protein NUV54_03005 [Candidatus Taylorbacteria bacterium]|nr:hypothetical protein [Candidatus Taylorbacteria bacterium]
MPYEIKKQGDQYCVVKIGGETVKCHENKDKALAHMRALWSNVHDSAIAEFGMSIVKATSKDGEMKWRSVNSDIEEDYFGEKMSLDLFADFNKHIENKDPIPEIFKSAICEEDWCGGMPYVSLSHYKTGANKVNVPGEVSKVYVDGKALKSTGTLYDTPLGKAVYKSLEKDLTEKSEKPVRISIGFLDTEHSHGEKFTFTRKGLADKCPLCKEGIGDKIYKKGHLVHLALTRVPANPRTEMELELKSMTTKLQDAESVIEDEEIMKTLDLKSLAEDVLVIKSEDADADEKDCPEGDEECMKKHKKDMKKEMSTAEPETPKENTVLTAASTTVTSGFVAVEPTPIEKALASLQNRIAALKSQGLSGDTALAEIQKNFDELGTIVKSEFTVAPTPEEVAQKNMETTLRSLLGEMLPQALAQVVAPMQSELGELRALSQARPQIKKEEIPQSRSLNVNLVQKAAIETLIAKTKPKDQFQAIADQSMGFQ